MTKIIQAIVNWLSTFLPKEPEVIQTTIITHQFELNRKQEIPDIALISRNRKIVPEFEKFLKNAVTIAYDQWGDKNVQNFAKFLLQEFLGQIENFRESEREKNE